MGEWTYSVTILDGDEWAASSTCRITPGRKTPSVHWSDGGWVPAPAWLRRQSKKYLLLSRICKMRVLQLEFTSCRLAYYWDVSRPPVCVLILCRSECERWCCVIDRCRPSLAAGRACASQPYRGTPNPPNPRRSIPHFLFYWHLSGGWEKGSRLVFVLIVGKQ